MILHEIPEIPFRRRVAYFLSVLTDDALPEFLPYGKPVHTASPQRNSALLLQIPFRNKSCLLQISGTKAAETPLHVLAP